MSNITITLSENNTLFIPGETITGSAEWYLDSDPKSIDIRLFWYTMGKGDMDIGIIAEQSVPAPQKMGSIPFRFTLPLEPYSVSGKLISIVWAIEVVVAPGKLTERTELTVSPWNKEIVVYQAPGA